MQIEELYKCYLECSHVSTDTRKIEPGSLFFALKGANFNGNSFASEALQKGARYVVIDEAAYQTSERHLLVDNGLHALQQLANFHRRQQHIPFIGITGSNGKTTTKELVHAVLSQKYRSYATQGNLNNHIGVPLTLLNMPADTEVAVIEMGANKVGDIAELCSIAEPNYGLITNIGYAHLEGFGGYEGVLRGKTELYDHLLRSEGSVLINSQDKVLSNTGRNFKHLYYFGSPGDFLYAKMTEPAPFIVYEDDKGQRIKTQLMGAYNFNNILTALAVGRLFGVADEAAHRAIAAYNPTNNRSQIVKGASNTLILDAYNANPSSMRVALENLSQLRADKKVAIIGDMFEMGEYSQEKHREILDLLLQLGFDQAIVCGDEFGKVYNNEPGVLHFAQKEALKKWLQQHPISHAHILIKASRGIGLESVVEDLKN